MYQLDDKAVVLAYQIRGQARAHPAALRLQALDEKKRYTVKQEGSDESEVITAPP